jgi:hypothetical protein
MSSRPRRLGCRAVAFLASLAAVAILVLIALRDWHLGGWLVIENGVVEWLQVILMGIAGVLAARQGLAAKRRGEPYALEVAIVAAMTMMCIGEVDLDRTLFGLKIIHTRFFVNPRYALGWRLLAVLVVVGVPTAVGVWLLAHIRDLWWASLRGLFEPWGQTATFGIALFMFVQMFERRLDHLPWQPPDFFEEVLELVAAIYIFVGLVARQRDIMSRMSVRPLIGIIVLALGLSACRGEFPASAASQEKPKPQAPAAGPPAREVSVTPATERSLPRTVAATGTLAAEDQMTLSAKVAGRVESIDVDLGTRIQRGQALARLDQTDFKLRVEQAEAALQQARARLGLTPSGKDEQVDPEQTSIVRQARAVLDEARLTRDRSVKLLEQQLIARSQLDTAEANLQVADGRYQDAQEEVRNRQAVLAQRRSELDLARQQLTDTVVLAPIDGAAASA